jgi:hypothetical protein
LCGVVGFGLVLAGVKLGSQATWVAGAVVYVACLYCIVRGWNEMMRTRRAISRALGITINRHDPPPPNRVTHYLAWCEKYNLEPYPFRPTDSPKWAHEKGCNS